MSPAIPASEIPTNRGRIRVRIVNRAAPTSLKSAVKLVRRGRARLVALDVEFSRLTQEELYGLMMLRPGVVGIRVIEDDDQPTPRASAPSAMPRVMWPAWYRPSEAPVSARDDSFWDGRSVIRFHADQSSQRGSYFTSPAGSLCYGRQPS